MKGRRQLKDIWKDPNMKELIDTLWREYPGLYNEKYNRWVGELVEPWLLNAFSPDIEFGQALGMDHSINGNQSTAIGIGAITRAFREMILGSYSTDAKIENPDLIPNPDSWVYLDRLFTLGNGTDKDNRSDALVIFKSGLTKIFNAIQISKYEHGLELPLDGMIQYLPQQLELYFAEAWHELALKSDIVPQVQSDWTEKNKALPQFVKNKPENIGTKVLHDFAAGNCIKLCANSWIKSVANNPENAGTVGLVSEIIDMDHFKYVTGGFLPGNYTIGADYFLSTSVAGGLMILSDPEIWEIGNVREFIGSGVEGGLIVEIDLGDEITEDVFPTQLQSDWNETDSSKKSFIKGKPTIPSAGIDDAPADGKLYGRRNKAWEPIVISMDNSVAVYINFKALTTFEYLCPENLKFTSLEYQNSAPTLSVELNTDLNKYQILTVRPISLGLVTLKGIIL